MRSLFSIIGLVALVSVYLMLQQVDYSTLARGLPILADMVGMFLPPDFTYLQEYVTLMLRDHRHRDQRDRDRRPDRHARWAC